jgi:hypothetical protein
VHTNDDKNLKQNKELLPGEEQLKYPCKYGMHRVLAHPNIAKQELALPSWNLRQWTKQIVGALKTIMGNYLIKTSETTRER